MTFVARPVIDRLFDKFDLTDTGCWIYTGYLTAGGYAQIRTGDRARTRHVAAYELFVGPVPRGLDLDHLCKRPACFNPRHLEPVTRRENIRRSDAWGGVNSRKTHCPQGHPYDRVNANGARTCRRCGRAASLRHLRRTQKIGASA